MSIDPDVLIDRRRLKRKLGFWRVVAFLAVAAAIAAGFFVFGGKDLIDRARPHIARISITGFIAPNRQLLEMIDKVGKSEAVKGVIVAIDSPGGATTGGEALYEALRRLSAQKPTVTSVSSLAASAGYMAAIGTDHIVARRNAITGSIGVLVQWGDVSKLMESIGVKFEEVKSSPLKAEPTPFKPASPEAKAMLDKMIRDSYDWFVEIVGERRGLSADEARALADGRVFTGHQALDLKLVDEIGGEEVAKAWLEDKKAVAKNLPIHDWKPARAGGGWPVSESLAFAVTRGVLSAVGLENMGRADGTLDGLRSVWHLESPEIVNNSGGVGQ